MKTSRPSLGLGAIDGEPVSEGVATLPLAPATSSIVLHGVR